MQSVNHTATGDDPHDLRHGVAMEMYGDHGDLEKVRALLGHQRIDTTQVYASFRPTQLNEPILPTVSSGRRAEVANRRRFM